MDWPAWVAPAQNLARQAGALILSERAKGLSVTIKPDGSPQSNADRAAEECITAGLKRLCSYIPVIAEESAPGTPPPANEPFWLVDPLDGTRSFLAGYDDYSINIALVIDQRPVFGLIYAPSRQELFWNDLNNAWFSSADLSMSRLAVRAIPAQGMTMITGRRTKIGARLGAWLENQPVAEHIMVSSALKYGYIALGKADIYPRFGETMEWDNAAGEAILQAAGGAVTALDGTPLLYGQADFLHHGLIATGCKAVF